MGITVDAIRLSPSLDTIVLVSGDGDYLPLGGIFAKSGQAGGSDGFWSNTASGRLKEVADDFTDLGGDKKPNF